MSNSDNKIKIMVVDDSVLIRKYVTQILNELPGMEVVCTAPNGKIAAQKVHINKLDMIILDIEMPEMNGIEFLKYLKANVDVSSRPIVLMFSTLVGNGSAATFEALANGAADFIKKPDGEISENIEFLKKEFEIKINELVNSRRDKLASLSKVSVSTVKEKAKEVEEKPVKEDYLVGLSNLQLILNKKQIKPEIYAIGSSTGGPNALRKMFEGLKPFHVPLVIAQHMPAGFTAEFAKNIKSSFNFDAVEAKDDELLENGKIYVCPGGSHAQIVKKGGRLYLKIDNSNYEGFFFRPSVDIFFRSINNAVGKNMVGYVLTGMGRDGSIDSVTLRKNGALIIAQDKETSVVWGMPGNTIKNGGADLVLSVDELAQSLNQIDKFYFG